MGKKNKRSNNKKKNSKQKPGKNSAARNAANRNGGASSGDYYNKGVYATYKACTEAVKQWGVTAWADVTHNSHEKSSVHVRGKSCTLTTLFQERFPRIAEAGLAMPRDVFESLRTAIRFRRRASVFYRSVPSASQDDHVRHEWLIEQLRMVEALFLAYSKRQDDGRVEGGSTASKTRSERQEKAQNSVFAGFEALAVSDDESSSEDESGPVETKSLERKVAVSLAPPSEEELAAEERCFAIACTLMEVTQTRKDFCDLWREWAKTQQSIGTVDDLLSPEDLKRAVGDLVAVQACTQYAVRMLRTSVLQTSVEFHSFDDFDQILAAFDSQHAAASGDYKVGDVVTLQRLQARPDLNGKSGMVSDEMSDGRYPIKLDGSKKAMLVKPENLIFSDDTFHRLNQVYLALQSFDFGSVPRLNNTYDADTSEVKAACARILGKLDDFNSCMAQKDFEAFLKLTVRHFLPVWMCYARVSGDGGAADELCKAYLFDFDKSRKVTFHLAFTILSLVDSSFAAYQTKKSLPQDAVRIFLKVLPYSLPFYKKTIECFDRHGFSTLCVYSHFEFIRLYKSTFYPMCHFFPLLSVEILLRGLRLNLIVATGITYQFWKEFMTLIHLYWMLRNEGYLGRVDSLEATMIRMYNQHVWFRGGLPEPGKCTYGKLWQISVGANIQAAQALNGRVWKTIPVFDRRTCFNQIRAIAREECGTILMAPLMQVALQLVDLEKALAERFVGDAVDFCKHWLHDYHRILQSLKDCPKVCFWAFALADDRADDDEKRAGLTRLASCFEDIFGASRGDSQSVPTLAFNPTDHKVDPSLWGEKGAKASNYSMR